MSEPSGREAERQGGAEGEAGEAEQGGGERAPGGEPHSDSAATAGPANTATSVTARDHLFQAMFSRIALTYDRTFPPVARRVIEFLLLITAVCVLFVLIYIHMAFVKAPITCLDEFAASDWMAEVEGDAGTGGTQQRHAVVRVEVLASPPPRYSLHNSYSKEYDDWNRTNQSESQNEERLSPNESFSQISTFFSIIRKQCFKSQSKTDLTVGENEENKSNSDSSKHGDKDQDKQHEGLFYKLFNFPINPILEKAEYWREKLSVRAMAPFRHTFNELELFAKSVFTEEKYIMEYSLEYGLLRLSPQTRERLKIPVHFVLLDSNKDQCFGNTISRFLLQEFVGYDQIIIGSLKRLAERQSGKGYVRNVVSGEHYRFVNSWMSRTSYLAAGFIMIIFTLSVSMLLRYSHHQIFVFIVDLLRMLENNLQFSFPAAPLLTVVLALVGMEAIMSEFFNDTSTAFYTILIIWLADQYEAVCCRTYISKRHWPKYFYLYHFAFYGYHYRFNGQFSGLALLCSWLFIQHSMFFFFHHYELPRLMHGIAVRAIMDSLIVERGENTSLAPSSVFINGDENDRSDGDRYDNDGDAGSSNMPSMAPSGESVPEKENKHTQISSGGEEPRSSGTNVQINGSNIHSNNCKISTTRLNSLPDKRYFVKKNDLSDLKKTNSGKVNSSKSKLSPGETVETFTSTVKRVSNIGDVSTCRVGNKGVSISSHKTMSSLVEGAVSTIIRSITATNIDITIDLWTDKSQYQLINTRKVVYKIRRNIIRQIPEKKHIIDSLSIKKEERVFKRFEVKNHSHDIQKEAGVSNSMSSINSKGRSLHVESKNQLNFPKLIDSHVNLSRKCVNSINQLVKIITRWSYVDSIQTLSRSNHLWDGRCRTLRSRPDLSEQLGPRTPHNYNTVNWSVNLFDDLQTDILNCDTSAPCFTHLNSDLRSVDNCCLTQGVFTIIPLLLDEPPDIHVLPLYYSMEYAPSISSYYMTLCSLSQDFCSTESSSTFFFITKNFAINTNYALSFLCSTILSCLITDKIIKNNIRDNLQESALVSIDHQKSTVTHLAADCSPNVHSGTDISSRASENIVVPYLDTLYFDALQAMVDRSRIPLLDSFHYHSISSIKFNDERSWISLQRITSDSSVSLGLQSDSEVLLTDLYCKHNEVAPDSTRRWHSTDNLVT